MLLAGDIGGTKTVLALFDVAADANFIARHPIIERTFPSQQYPSLELIIDEFLRDTDHHIPAGSFGVAGPV
ncbi:MAG: glucokinase, partial [Rhodococcus sp. (in: high G+C Gram-positive bacteria)]|uniref:glucokinase n=1 Tax=Rhodococcus sp. TaxID=1831 RepID=UPI003BB676A9